MPQKKAGGQNVKVLVLTCFDYNCRQGVALMASSLRVHANVKMKIPLALLIPHLNLRVALNRGAAKTRGCQIFFSHLSSLSEFCSRSPKPELDDTCQRQLPRMHRISRMEFDFQTSVHGGEERCNAGAFLENGVTLQWINIMMWWLDCRSFRSVIMMRLKSADHPHLLLLPSTNEHLCDAWKFAVVVRRLS